MHVHETIKSDVKVLWNMICRMLGEIQPNKKKDLFNWTISLQQALTNVKFQQERWSGCRTQNGTLQTQSNPCYTTPHPASASYHEPWLSSTLYDTFQIMCS